MPILRELSFNDTIKRCAEEDDNEYLLDYIARDSSLYEYDEETMELIYTAIIKYNAVKCLDSLLWSNMMGIRALLTAKPLTRKCYDIIVDNREYFDWSDDDWDRLKGNIIK